MPDLRLLLRFGNQRADTIQEHKATIEASGYVWWAWWAKSYEKVPSTSEWDQIEAAIEAGTEVGLLDRRTMRFYAARCDSLARSEDDRARIPSPEADATPSYYANEYFPVWFRFTGIRDLLPGEFAARFGPVPLANDQTLYVLGDGRKVKDPHQIDFVSTGSATILHLSDLHFGKDYGFGAQTGFEERAGSHLEEQIIEYVRAERCSIGTVVISGDLITCGIEKYYRDVDTFMGRLLDGLGLDKSNLVVVPGNHDLWLDDVAQFTYAHDYRHEQGYREWYDRFYSEEHRSIERLIIVECAEQDLSLAFVQSNSARLREPETMEFGYVGRHRYVKLLEVLNEFDRDPLISFFVMHHHLQPVPGKEAVRAGRPISVTVDSGQIIEDLQRYNVQCVLHGHQHIPYVGCAGRMSFDDHANKAGHNHPVAIVGCGSTGAVSTRLAPDLPANIFGLYEPTPGELDVRFVQCTPGGYTRRWDSTKVNLPSRPT